MKKIIVGYTIKTAKTREKIPIDWIFLQTTRNTWTEEIKKGLGSHSFPTYYEPITRSETIHYFKEPIYRKTRKK